MARPGRGRGVARSPEAGFVALSPRFNKSRPKIKPAATMDDGLNRHNQREWPGGWSMDCPRRGKLFFRETSGMQERKTMSRTIQTINQQMNKAGLRFTHTPIVIGGMAMEYYGLRTSGPDIDLVVHDDDYHALANRYPERRKDIYGDLGVVLEPFEIWRSIALLDYGFFTSGAVAEGDWLVLSMDKLLLTRACAMEVPKYAKDMQLIVEGVYARSRNPGFLALAETHGAQYRKCGGIVWGGRYAD